MGIRFGMNSTDRQEDDFNEQTRKGNTSILRGSYLDRRINTYPYAHTKTQIGCT